MGIGGDTGRAKKNGAEKAPFVFVVEDGKVMVRGGSGKNRKRDVDHMISGRIGRLIGRHIVRNLDGRRNERDMRDVLNMRDMLNTRWLRHRGHSTKPLYHSSIFTLVEANAEADDRTSLWKDVLPTQP